MSATGAARAIIDAPLVKPAEARAPRWPEMGSQALHGLPGLVVNTIDPHTEAAPSAVLFQFMAAFGNVIGRSAHYRVEADRHCCNLFPVIVGESAKGRKGTSWGHVRSLCAAADSEWADTRVVSGLSSGEGLKYLVRDPRTEKQAIKERGRVVDYQYVETDEGVNDKRLLVVESEFGGTLRVLQREGNTLSAVIRCAWDDGRLRTLTKSDPTEATDAHISIIGHVTAQELLRYLGATDAANGFANRFLFVCAKRSKLLPDGGCLSRQELAPLEAQIAKAVSFARAVGELRRDSSARGLWREIYQDLSVAKPGLLGSVTARAEAQVVRLSGLYALGDLSSEIRVEHLLAGLAAWQFCDDSAKYIFGTLTGDPVADRIEQELAALPGGMTRTEISNLFGRNQTAARIGKALDLLREAGRVGKDSVQGGDGRPSERWSIRDTN